MSSFTATPTGNRLFLIINPISGTHSKAGLDTRLRDKLQAAGFDVTVAFTECRGDATRLARKAVEQQYDGVLACGGDGTVNETARAMVDTGVAMGIIPAGSGNGLARHIGIPIDPIAAVDIVAERHVRDCDYATVNGTPYFCTFGVGFDAAVSDRFAAAGTRGKLTYVKSALSEFVGYHPGEYRITADGEELADRAYIVAVCNANQYGNNAYIAPAASITDGLLDLVLVRDIPRIKVAMLGVGMMWGTLANSRNIIHRKVRNVSIERLQPGPAHIDGEPVKISTQINVECRPAGLRMFVNASKKHFTPVITPIESMFNDITLSIRNLFS